MLLIITLYIIAAAYNTSLTYWYFTRLEHRPFTWRAYTILFAVNTIFWLILLPAFHLYLFLGWYTAEKHHLSFYDYIQIINNPYGRRRNW